MKDAPANHKIAVIVPAFKPDFLSEALECLVRQTDQRFSLYVYDDASPADIQGIARSALGARPYVYKRFDENLGGMSLAKHWNRCVGLSSEPWVWLFSDDDLIDDNCIEAFHKFLETDQSAADVLHFGLVNIHEDKSYAEMIPPYMERETWLEFAYGHLRGWRIIAQQNLVFRRSAFEEAGRFLDTPFCWWGDAALAIALARSKGICWIRGARVFWRHSRQNINGTVSLRARTKKLQAACLYIRWLQEQLETPRDHLFPGDESSFRREMDRFLVSEVVSDGLLPAITNWRLLSNTRAHVCHGSSLALLKYAAMAAVSDFFSALGRNINEFAGRSSKR